MKPQDVPVNVWNPAMMPADAAVVCFGRRRSGKSWLMRDILYCYRDVFDRGLVFTGTKANYFFQYVPDEKRPEDIRKEGLPNGFIPEQAVVDGYDKSVLGNFLGLQMNIRENAERYRKEQGYELPAFVVLDDVIDDGEIRRDGQSGHLLSLFSKGRHYKLFTILATQYPKAIPARVRDNLDFAIIFRLESKLEKEAMLEHFMGELNPRTAEEVMRMYTHREEGGPVQCLIIDLRAGTPFDKKYFTYVARGELPEFKMGSKVFWDEMGYRGDEDAMVQIRLK